VSCGLDALSADKMLMDALGLLRATAYLAVKRSEAGLLLVAVPTSRS
jgi:hypothetical protein